MPHRANKFTILLNNEFDDGVRYVRYAMCFGPGRIFHHYLVLGLRRGGQKQ